MDELLEMGRGGEAILTHTSVLRGHPLWGGGLSGQVDKIT